MFVRGPETSQHAGQTFPSSAGSAVWPGPLLLAPVLQTLIINRCHIGVVLGLYTGHIGVILGLYRDSGNKMETTRILGVY